MFDEAGIRAFLATQGVPGAVARVRAHVRQRALLALLLWCAAALGLALAVAWLLAGSDGWRQGSPVPLLLDLTLVVAAGALAWWLKNGDRTWLAEERLARAMESSAGLAAGTVEGALQLSRAVPPGVSSSLTALAQRTVAGSLTLPPEELSGPIGARVRLWIRRGGAALALTAPLVVLLAVASPDRSLDAWSGLGNPIGALARATLPALAVEPGNAEVLRGSPVSVTVDAIGRTEVTLRWQAEGDVLRSETVATEGGVARFRFDAVNATIEYSAATADGATTRSYRIEPVDPLLVSQVSVELAFPPYTGRPAEAYEGEVPPLVVPAGTRFSITGRATRPLGAAELEREEDGLRVPFETEGAGFVGSWTPRTGGRYAWRFRDRNDADAELVPSPIDVTVVADSAPSIRFAFPAVDTVLPLTLEQPLVIEMKDDYGVGALELVAYRVTSTGQRMPPMVQRTELGGTRAALARPIMDLKDWGLLPGDTVRYFARAVDNAPSPSAAQTREYVLRMPDVGELRRDAQDELESMTERLEQLAERARRAEDASRDLEREAAAQQRPDPAAPGARRPDESLAGFEEREQLRQALEDQERMSDEARQAREELEAIADALREAGASDPQFNRDLQELQTLLEELTSPEQQQRLEQMAEELDESDAADAEQMLEELAEQQERFRDQLQSSLERLRRAAVEQDFRATMKDARELAQREQALADALREGGQPGLREEQQEELRDLARELRERMERLEDRLAEVDEGAALAGVEQAQIEAQQGEQAMEAARAALEQQAQGNQSPQALRQPNQRAGQQAESASESMEKAAAQLEQAQQQMSSERRAAMRRLLDQAGADALALARRQSEIRRGVANARPEALAQLRGDESALLQGLQGLAGGLTTASAEAPQLEDAVAQLGVAIDAVEQAVQSFDTRAGQPGPENAADGALQQLNRLAIVVMEAGRPSGEGSDAGEGGDPSEQLDAAAQQQGDLNNQMAQLLQMMLGEQAMREQMQQMAAAQEQVADQIEEVADQPAAEGEVLGDLDALAAEARELAERLQGGRLDPDTRERQERLFHRLLDAGRMLENDETSENREAEAAQAFERGDVLPLGPDALGVLKYGLPAAEQLQRLSPAERELVLRYFDRLNRATPEGAGAGAPAETPAPDSPPAETPAEPAAPGVRP